MQMISTNFSKFLSKFGSPGAGLKNTKDYYKPKKYYYKKFYYKKYYYKPKYYYKKSYYKDYYSKPYYGYESYGHDHKDSYGYY
ncbi:hypothetical protein WR25_05471 [Diploscapter pachys]|uniref:Uncharacterized protein n=1 Tax=Diploscapter pachys TaxID=2018661 RepID=A0A2A2LYG9_9BILA|nr:hypothetical protein WR25_05471 [Diploscapter pachys]